MFAPAGQTTARAGSRSELAALVVRRQALTPPRGVEDAAPEARVPLGGAQRAPPVCFANTLLRLIAPRGQSLCAPQFRCAQLWPHAHNPAPHPQQRDFSLLLSFGHKRK